MHSLCSQIGNAVAVPVALALAQPLPARGARTARCHSPSAASSDSDSPPSLRPHRSLLTPLAPLAPSLTRLTAMEAFVGKFVLESSEKFDEFLSAIGKSCRLTVSLTAVSPMLMSGVGFVMRNMAKVQTPTVEIATDGDNVTLKTITTFKTQEIKFKLNEEFEEKRLDGALVKSTVTLDGDKLVQHQKADTSCDIIREIEGDKLKTVSLLVACGHC